MSSKLLEQERVAFHSFDGEINGALRYQWSLEYFNNLFKMRMDKSEQSDDLATRVPLIPPSGSSSEIGRRKRVDTVEAQKADRYRSVIHD